MDSLALAKFAYIFYFSCQLQWFSTFSEPVKNLKNCSFLAIFNFGDSNSDTGKQAASDPDGGAPFSHLYHFKPPNRISDGRLIIDFMASNLTLPFLNPYLNDPAGAKYRTGANFAVGGATILSHPKSYTTTYLATESQQFAQFVHKSQQKYFSQALYTIDIGQNDIALRLLDSTTMEEIKALIPSLVDAIVVHVKELYALGGRSFWIHNTGPIGCLEKYSSCNPPLPLSEQKDKAGCVIPYNNVAQYFNTKLKESVVKLRVTLPLAAITYVDIYSIKYSFFSQPKKYGFSDPLVPCGDVMDLCQKRQVKKVTWDPIHYTEAANKIVSDLISTGSYSDPPVAPSVACN